MKQNTCMFRAQSHQQHLHATTAVSRPPILLPMFLQVVVDFQQVITMLPQHLLAVLLAACSNILQSGNHWAERAGLTEVTLSDEGPWEHVVRGVGVMVTLLEILPKYR